MRIPIAWLKEYIDIDGTAQEISDALTMSGTAIEGIETLGQDQILIAEITTNRPDCLSLLGIALELSAVRGKAIKIPQIKEPLITTANTLPLSIEVLDKKACPGYTARVFDEVKINSAPPQMIRQLESMALRPVNNIVDITNYCLFEIGQPLHAFDYDKVVGQKIIVRYAKKGEKILALNDIVYELDPSILIIADTLKPIAIAGVIGGKETGITSSTQRIILESARFDAILIRQTARKLKISTDSSYRFERSIDPNKAIQCSNRAAELIQKHAQALVASKLFTVGSLKAPKSPIIKLKQTTIRRIFGKDFSLKHASLILKNLGFGTSLIKANAVSVTGWSGRSDIKEEIDLIEELIRLHGFENIDEAIPVTKYAGTPVKLSNYNVTRQLKEMLVAQGFWEVVTLSLVSRQKVSQMQIGTKEPLITIQNPLSREQEVLRPLALSGLLDALAHNANRKEKDLMLFEVGKRYLGGVERESLALLISGDIQSTWVNKTEASFYYLKGVLESVYTRFNKPMPTWKPQAFLPQTLVNAVVDGDSQNLVSFNAELQPAVLSEWGIESKVYYAEILLDQFFLLDEKKQSFKTLPKFPPVRRDVAILVNESVSIADIEKHVRKKAQKYLTRFFLFDEYHGKSIPKGRRSLAFSLQYEKTDGTFTDEEIVDIHTGVIDELIQKYKIEIR